MPAGALLSTLVDYDLSNPSPVMQVQVFILIFVTCGHHVTAQYEDFRCKCICPSPTVVEPNATVIPPSTVNNGSVKNTSTVEPVANHPSKVSVSASKPQRSLYIANVRPQHCNCDWVVLPQLTQTVIVKAKEFCPRCECKYESRNITTIKWVVSVSISIICCLIIYMGYLILVAPLINRSNPRVRRPLYEQQIDDDHIRQSNT